MSQSLTARNVSVQELFTLVGDLKARQVDVVVKATDLAATTNGQIEVTGHDPILSETGITSVNGLYTPSAIFDEHLASALKMGLPYTRRMAAERADIWAANVNGWLHGNTWGRDAEPEYKPDPRSFLLRAYAGADGDGSQNIARGLLSDRYGIIDNYDVLMATLKAISEADDDGTIRVAGADLSERRMFVRFVSDQIAVNAADLLRGYRSPFDQGETRANQEAARAAGLIHKRGTEPVIWAGFELANSELGSGAYSLTPRGEIEICGNGQKIVKDISRDVHRGARLDHGTIKWSDATQAAQLKLITEKTKDAVRAFLSAEYWETQVAELTAKAGKPVDDPAKALEKVSKSLAFTEGEAKDIMRHFIKGGQSTAGGVMNAVTSVAQTVADADRAAELEASAVKVLDLV